MPTSNVAQYVDPRRPQRPEASAEVLKTPPRSTPESDEDRDLFRLDDLTLIAQVRKGVQSCRDNRSDLEGKWLECLEQYAGNQWTWWSRADHRMIRPERGTGEVRFVANRLKGMVYTILGHLISAEVGYVPLPRGRSLESKHRAQVAEQLLHYLDRILDTDTVMTEWFLWTLICGTSALKTTWDPYAGRKLEDDEVREALTNVVPIAPGVELPAIYDGQIRREVVSPFNLFPNVSATSPRDIRELTELHRVHIDEARRQYPDFADYFQADSVGGDEDSRQQAQYAFTGAMSSAPTVEAEKSVTIYEHRRYRTHDYPRGLKVVCTKDFVISRTPAERRNPYRWLRYQVIPGRFWAQGMLDDAIPIQTEINHTRSLIAKWARSFSAPQWLAPKGSVSGDWRPTNRNDSVIWYTPMFGKGPEPVAMPNPPSAFLHHLNLLYDELKAATGVEDALRAKSSFSGESGRHAAIQFEAAATRFVAFQNGIREARKEEALTCLDLARENYDEERTIRLYGKDGQAEVLTFLGKDDIEEDMELDVILEAFGQNKAVRRQEILFAWGQKALLDADGRPDVKSLRKALQFGDTREIYNSRAAEENDAVMQADAMVASGQPIPVDPFEDHATHVETKVDRLLSFKREGKVTPEGEAALRQNIGEHLAYRQRELVAMAAAAAGAQPGAEPGTQGGPEAGTDVSTSAAQVSPDGGTARQEGLTGSIIASESTGR